MWNTGLWLVTNKSDRNIRIIDGENVGYQWYVLSGRQVWCWGVIFPWCSNSEEIASKAFRVKYEDSSGWRGLCYMYQRFQDDRIYWSPWNGGCPSMANNNFFGLNPSSYVDIVFQNRSTADITPTPVASSSEGPGKSSFNFSVNVDGETVFMAEGQFLESDHQAPQSMDNDQQAPQSSGIESVMINQIEWVITCPKCGTRTYYRGRDFHYPFPPPRP
jgi:hypothetical protein